MKKLAMTENWKIGRNIKSDGAYEGEVKEGKRHGLGKLTIKTKDMIFSHVYFGEFKNGKLNGLGFYNGLTKYEGEFKDGK
jgi:hypothetical protein